jgi:hypothetical protein
MRGPCGASVVRARRTGVSPGGSDFGTAFADSFVVASDAGSRFDAGAPRVLSARAAGLAAGVGTACAADLADAAGATGAAGFADAALAVGVAGFDAVGGAAVDAAADFGAAGAPDVEGAAVFEAAGVERDKEGIATFEPAALPADAAGIAGFAGGGKPDAEAATSTEAAADGERGPEAGLGVALGVADAVDPARALGSGGAFDAERVVGAAIGGVAGERDSRPEASSTSTAAALTTSARAAAGAAARSAAGRSATGRSAAAGADIGGVTALADTGVASGIGATDVDGIGLTGVTDATDVDVVGAAGDTDVEVIGGSITTCPGSAITTPGVTRCPLSHASISATSGRSWGCRRKHHATISRKAAGRSGGNTTVPAPPSNPNG